MSNFLDRLTFFKRHRESFSNDHGVTVDEDRRWEDGYRSRWQHDKVVRSTHGVNCTGSCSWKIYVKTGWSPGKPSRPTTHARARGCPTMSPAAAPGVRASRGTSTVPTV